LDFSILLDHSVAAKGWKRKSHREETSAIPEPAFGAATCLNKAND
jgi:hypothetical protein